MLKKFINEITTIFLILSLITGNTVTIASEINLNSDDKLEVVNKFKKFSTMGEIFQSFESFPTEFVNVLDNTKKRSDLIFPELSLKNGEFLIKVDQKVYEFKIISRKRVILNNTLVELNDNFEDMYSKILAIDAKNKFSILEMISPNAYGVLALLGYIVSLILTITWIGAAVNFFYKKLLKKNYTKLREQLKPLYKLCMEITSKNSKDEIEHLVNALNLLSVELKKLEKRKEFETIQVESRNAITKCEDKITEVKSGDSTITHLPFKISQPLPDEKRVNSGMKSKGLIEIESETKIQGEKEANQVE